MLSEIRQNDLRSQTVYVGIDVHKRQWKVSVMVSDVLHKTFSQPPDPEKLSKHLRKYYPGAKYKAAYEAGCFGYWPQQKLSQLGVETIVVHPADIPTTDKEKRQKEDRRDSRKIARGLCNQELEGIYVHSKKNLQDRFLLRVRSKISRDMARYKNRIKSELTFQGIEMPDAFADSNKHWSRRFVDWLQSIQMKESSWNHAFQLMLDEYLHLRDAKLNVERQVRALARTGCYKKPVECLLSLYGIGLVTAMTLLTELETVTRFKTLDQLCSYIGFVPSMNSSGDRHRTGGITPRRHRQLRSMLIESAWTAVRNDPDLALAYKKLATRMAKNRAIVRIAKKLLNRIRFVLIQEQPYMNSNKLALN